MSGDDDNNDWTRRAGRRIGAAVTAVLATIAGLGPIALRLGRGAAHEAAPVVREAAEAASAERQGLRSVAPTIERQVVRRGAETVSHADPNATLRALRSEPASAAPAVIARAGALAPASTELGKRVFALRNRVPPAVFQALIRRWQQNDADIRAAADAPATSDRPGRLEQLHGEQEAIEQEVRRLVTIYG